MLTVFCQRLVGTVVALEQAGWPQKLVNKKNLTCSLISFTFSCCSSWWQDLLCLCHGPTHGMGVFSTHSLTPGLSPVP